MLGKSSFKGAFTMHRSRSRRGLKDRDLKKKDNVTATFTMHRSRLDTAPSPRQRVYNEDWSKGEMESPD